jgi:hypothetical protein
MTDKPSPMGFGQRVPAFVKIIGGAHDGLEFESWGAQANIALTRTRHYTDEITGQTTIRDTGPSLHFYKRSECYIDTSGKHGHCRVLMMEYKHERTEPRKG